MTMTQLPDRFRYFISIYRKTPGSIVIQVWRTLLKRVACFLYCMILWSAFVCARAICWGAEHISIPAWENGKVLIDWSIRQYINETNRHELVTEHFIHMNIPSHVYVCDNCLSISVWACTVIYNGVWSRKLSIAQIPGQIQEGYSICCCSVAILIRYDCDSNMVRIHGTVYQSYITMLSYTFIDQLCL